MRTVSLDGPRLPPAAGPARQLVVFLHGYGADGKDLIGLGQHWQELLPNAAFASPHAPERCAAGGTGYQWFGLSRMDPHETARGTETAGPTLDAFLDAELARLRLAPENLALVGFSQGTMMALHVGLRRKIMPTCIVGFSGMLTSPEKLPKAGPGRPPILLTHGDEDQIIPAPALFFSAGALGAAGLSVRWHLSQGLGHGIDPTGLALAGQFLRDAFRGRWQQVAPVSCRYPR